MNGISVVCFLWWNPEFRAQYVPARVNTLYSMVKRHLSIPFKFYCAIGDRIDCTSAIAVAREELRSQIEVISLEGSPTFRPDVVGEQLGSWPCLSLFNPALQDQLAYDVILKLDLDSVITGSLDPLVKRIDSERITGWLDITHKILNPSFALMRKGFGGFIWDTFLNKPEDVKYLVETGDADRFGWDQAWLNRCTPETMKKFLTRADGVYHRREIERRGKLPGDARIVYFNATHKPWHENMKLKYPWIKDHYR